MGEVVGEAKAVIEALRLVFCPGDKLVAVTLKFGHLAGRNPKIRNDRAALILCSHG
jgi:hypothetical protein